MCGIAGYVGKGDKVILEKMTDALQHRGPDDDGFFVHGNTGLGHRRLSIIDVDGGKQPIFNEDKTIAIIFNGEIYNYQALRKTLEGRHKFYTNTDTEVIVHLYEEKGEQFVEYLEGMFALAIWDIRLQKLLLARDRFGEKPIYYMQKDGTFIFASELKSIAQHPLFSREINFGALQNYFLYEYVPSPQSIFSDVYKLEPANIITVVGNVVTKKQYWRIPFEKLPAQAVKNEQDITKQLEDLLSNAVSSRLMSDVPLGVFLSGGIDSGTVAYFAQKHNNRPIDTFSIGFEDASYDESNWSNLLAKRLGTHHYERIFLSKDFKELLPAIFDQLDEPFADASLIPTYALSQFAHTHAKVILGGDGGDEFMMGYATFTAHKLYRLLRIMPKPVHNFILNPLARMLPVSFADFSFDFKMRKFFSGSTITNDFLRDQVWLSAFTPSEITQLLVPKFSVSSVNNIEANVVDRNSEGANLNFWDRLVYKYASNYLPDDILVKVDRASMMNSLEVRAPLLDTNLITFLNSLQDNYKMHGMTSKYILKKTMEPYLGKDIVYRKKKGFSAPVAMWLQSALKDELGALLDKKFIEQQGIFQYSYIERILHEHYTRKANHRQKLWSLFVFQNWYKRWIV